MPLRTRSTRTARSTRPASLLLATALAATTLTGCALADLAQDCEGTDAKVAEMAAVGVLGSRPDGATVPEGFEEVDSGCWADSGDVALYAGRTYAFPGTRAEVTAHYRTVTAREGWQPHPDASPGELCFAREDEQGMVLRVTFLTAESLAEDGHGDRPDLTTGAAYSVDVEAYDDSDVEAGC
ncbi:hypothetical protein ABZX40_03610 [Streptomyces sp. NPDC004610]|uniref:hypothetical protein n=1 Tax=unclassified Streptomyces TaxID=2593676 RepID=UPI0033A3CF2F